MPRPITLKFAPMKAFPNRAARRRKHASRVEKIDGFRGSLSDRALYIYLPPRYDLEPRRHYPVLLMHDGQNCFEAYKEDSFGGLTWRVEAAADRLIATQKMRPCIIVGVANGRESRLREYTPPYATWFPEPHPDQASGMADFSGHQFNKGEADLTFNYYQEEVMPFLRERYRLLGGRHHIATCGSSLGGLFSTYIAWEHPHFAKHHAALSASYWVTARSDGQLEIAERLRTQPRRDIRLWLDSGTGDADGVGDDNAGVVRQVRDALTANGYVDGRDMRYFLDIGALHNETAWATRLPQVLRYLFPPTT